MANFTNSVWIMQELPWMSYEVKGLKGLGVESVIISTLELY